MHMIVIIKYKQFVGAIHESPDIKIKRAIHELPLQNDASNYVDRRSMLLSKMIQVSS